MVATERSSSARSAPPSCDSSLCWMRSADSWIGISGFLISCARRRATSAQAIERCADTTSVMSSNTISRASLGSTAPRTSRFSAVCSLTRRSNASCQWSRSPASGLARVQLEALPDLCARTPPGRAPRPACRPRYTDSGWRRMRVAPGFTVSMPRWRSNTMTPALNESRIVCSRVRAPSSCVTPRPTCSRASASCSVMRAKARVRPPSSSREANTGLAVRSPSATSRTPSASTTSGRAIWLPRIAATSTAPNTASTSASVSVPMYMRRRPSCAMARRWYSR